MVAIRTSTAILIATLLGACSGESRDTAPPADEMSSLATSHSGAVRLVDAGAEPRVDLGITRLGLSDLSVSATSTTDGALGGESFADRVAASYRLEVELSEDTYRDQIVARFTPTIIETSGLPVTREPGSWEWRLGVDGVPVSAPPPAVAPGSPLAALLSTHGLVLIVPAEPVGEGARWTYAGRPGDPPVEIALDAVGDDDLAATMTARLDRDGARLELTASGRWDRASLLARQATSRVETTITATTTRNGEEIAAEASKLAELVYEGGP